MADPVQPNLDELLGRKQVKPPKGDSRRDKWIRWIDKIREDHFGLWVNRMAWRRLTVIWEERDPPLPSSLLFEYFQRTYADTQIAGVRRHVDTHLEAAGLCRLLLEISQFPESLSREFYVSRYEWGQQHLGDREYAQWDPEGLGHVDGAIAADDREELIKVAEPIWTWANMRVAHLDPRDPKDVPPLSDLESALHLIQEKYRRWRLILSGIDEEDPVVVYDWLAPLREAWIIGAQ